MRRICSLGHVFAVVATTSLSAGAIAQGYDAIGPNSSTTTGGTWISSTSNTDPSGTFFTAAGTGSITIPAGKRLTVVRAVIGQEGPSGAGAVNFSLVQSWSVEVWTDNTAFKNAPTHGDVLSITYPAPGAIQAWGQDENGNPAYRVTFNLPGGLPLQSGVPYYFAVRASMSFSGVGQVGVQESNVSGTTGYVMGTPFSSPLPLTFFPNHQHNGVFAYQFTAGCTADFNGSGAVSVQDLFDFLAAWFARTPGADFNGNGTISVQDLFDFLAAWFTPCAS